MAKAKRKKITLEEALVPVEEQPYEVPENWCWIHLLDSFDNVTDSKKKLVTKEYLEEGEYPIIDQGQDFIGGYTDDADMIYDGELPIVIFGDHTRCIKYIDFQFAQGADGVKVLKPKQFWNDKAFYYAMQSIEIPNMGYRRHYPLFKDFCIPLPPLAEQKRIVEQIESLFSKLDEAKEKAQEALDGFENRKASILGKAMNGALTQNWRKDNGIDMDSWKETKFRDFCLLKRGYDLPTSQRSEGEYPLVTSSGINDYVSEFKVKGPGVITGRSGTIGKVYLVLEDFWPLNTTLYSEKLFANDAEFVFYYLQTFNFKEYSSSTAVPTLNRNLFLDKIILVPCINEQREIVKCINNLLGEEKETIASINKCIDNIDIMKKSILAKAFRGELGTNIPEDESAIELLKIILDKGDANG